MFWNCEALNKTYSPISNPPSDHFEADNIGMINWRQVNQLLNIIISQIIDW